MRLRYNGIFVFFPNVDARAKTNLDALMIGFSVSILFTISEGEENEERKFPLS